MVTRGPIAFEAPKKMFFPACTLRKLEPLYSSLKAFLSGLTPILQEKKSPKMFLSYLAGDEYDTLA